MDLRMKKAKELLNDVRNSVSDVAIRIGFQSYASFYRAFVRINNISPSQYRDLMQDQSKEFYENTH
jgi:two-component system response regulator YesN